MELVQFPFCDASDALMAPAKFTPENSFGLLIPERPNHKSRVLPRHVKCNEAHVAQGHA